MTTEHSSRGFILFILAGWFVLAGLAHGKDSSSENSFREALKETLPDIAVPLNQTIAGYERPETVPPSLMVSAFYYEGNDNLPMGYIVPHILRWNIFYCTRNSIQAPDLLTANLETDLHSREALAGKVLTATDGLVLLHQRRGIDYLLTGSVQITDSTFLLDTTLSSLPDFEEFQKYAAQGPIEEFAHGLNSIVMDLYESLGTPLGEEGKSYLEGLTPKTHQDFLSFAEYLQRSWNNEIEDWDPEFWEQLGTRYTHPFVVMDYVRRNDEKRKNDFDAYTKDMERLAEIFNEDPGVSLNLAKSIDASDDIQSRRQARIDLLFRAIPERPNDPSGLLSLGETYIYTGEYQKALGVYMEMAERWPDDYRSWWGVTDALLELGWKYRGTTYWSRIESENRDKFTDCLRLADIAADHAIELHPDCTRLWDDKMRILGSVLGREPELFDYFENAVETCPSCHYIYDHILNFLRPQWGGTWEDQRRVIETAIKNTPEGDWPYRMDIEYACQRIVYLESDADLFDPEYLAELASKMIPTAKKALSRDSLNHLCYDTLNMFVRGGDSEHGSQMVGKALDAFVEGRDDLPKQRERFRFAMAEFALQFGDIDLAARTLDKYEPQDSLAGYNYRIPSLKAAIQILESTDSDLTSLKAIIEKGPDNPYAKELVLRLGIDRQIDSELYYRCLADLTTWEPSSESPAIPLNENEQANTESEQKEDLAFILKNLALGHQASKKGELETAALLYREALERQRQESGHFESIE
ncbi:MAG: hypothetical protein KC964_02420, partial [Candidatus Omnitrophica bacterium]|nr:hypothetical protein [Candidatus Omnitrophota bacterium]